MKIQIISRLTRNSQGSNTRQTKETSIRKENRNYIRVQDHIQTEYYPLHDALNEEEESESRKVNQYRLFFENFHEKHAVIYQKNAREATKPHKQLEPLLAVINQSPKKKVENKHPDYEFSFKKMQGTPSTVNTELNETSKDNLQPYFFNRGQKSKLRKFNSLMVLKCQQSQREDSQPSFQGQKITLRKNCSLMKCDESSFHNESVRHKISLPLTNFEGEWKRTLDNVQTERAFAEQKERLAKIRMQLNEIYQMRKPTTRLHLF